MSGARLERAVAVLTGHAGTVGYLAAWRLVRTVPEPVARAAFDALAAGVFRADAASVRRLRGNLARVVEADALEETVAEGVRRYFRYWCEAFRLPSWPTADLLERVRVDGEDRLRDGLAAGRGVVIALPHMGNWDWAGAWACQRHAPLMTVAERLRPERLYDEFVRYREGLGMRVLPLRGGDPPLPILQDWLERGGLVCLLTDRDLSRGHVRVDFFGEPARFAVGPAVLAERTGATLLPATLHHEDRNLRIRLHAPVESGTVAERSQAIADVFAAGIAEHPADWHMMQRVFEADLR